MRVEVNAWGDKVATLLEHHGIVYMQSEPIVQTLSPLQITAAETKSYETLTFQHGLCGLISDHLPGEYGMSFMDAFFVDQHGKKPSILERLSFIGSNALGALEFVPSSTKTMRDETVPLQEIYRSSKKALERAHDFKIAPLLAISNSAGGGARAKAIAGFNAQNETIFISSKHSVMPDGFIPSIIKFDEFKEKGHPYRPELYTNASVYTKTEYLYYTFATALGITMSPSTYVQNEEGFHFITQRFDTDTQQRFHMHSLSGLLHHDAGKPMTLDYEMLFRTGKALGIPADNFEQMYRVMIFNLVFGNRDDHSKNYAFLFDFKKGWRFAPAYDLTYIINRGAAQEHQLSINKQPASWADRHTLIEMGTKFGVRTCKAIIDATIALKHQKLRSDATAMEMPQAWIDEIFAHTAAIDSNIGKT